MNYRAIAINRLTNGASYEEDGVMKFGGIVLTEEQIASEAVTVELEYAKTDKVSEINRQCGAAIIGGFTSNALGSIKHYQSEEVDQLNLIGMVTAGTDDYFKTGTDDANGVITWVYELHTIAQLKQVLADGKAYKLTLLLNAAQLKDQVASAQSVSDVALISVVF